MIWCIHLVLQLIADILHQWWTLNSLASHTMPSCQRTQEATQSSCLHIKHKSKLQVDNSCSKMIILLHLINLLWLLVIFNHKILHSKKGQEKLQLSLKVNWLIVLKCLYSLFQEWSMILKIIWELKDKLVTWLSSFCQLNFLMSSVLTLCWIISPKMLSWTVKMKLIDKLDKRLQELGLDFQFLLSIGIQNGSTKLYQHLLREEWDKIGITLKNMYG